MAVEEAGENEGGTLAAIFFEARKEMKEKRIVKIGDDEMSGGKLSAKGVGDGEIYFGVEAIDAGVALGFLDSRGIDIPTDGVSAEFGRSESKNARTAAQIEDDGVG